MPRVDLRAWTSLALLAVAAHAPALTGGFVWLDDAHLGAGVGDGLALVPLSRFWTAFTDGFAGTGYYRPLVTLSLSVDAAIAHQPWLYHLVSLLWHAAAAVMVAVTAGSLGLTARTAWTAGALFAVHPQTSVVAGAIAFRSEAMLAVALFALIICHMRGRFVGAGLAMAAAGLCKETGLVLGPAWLVAIAIARHAQALEAGKGIDRRNQRKSWVASGVGLLAAFGLRVAFAPDWRASFPQLSATQAVATRLGSVGKSALALAVPADQTICDAFPILGLTDGLALLGMFVAAALIAAALRERGLWLLLLVSALPTLQLVPVMRWWSPHYLYLPLAFAAMLAARGADRLTGATRWAPLLLLAVFAISSFRSAFRFRSDEALWTAEVRANDACLEGHFYLAMAAHHANQLPTAIVHHQRAVANPAGVLAYVDRQAAWQNLGAAYLAVGQLGPARGALETALALTSGSLERRRLTYNLAVVAFRAGDPVQTLRLLAPVGVGADELPEARALAAAARARLR